MLACELRLALGLVYAARVFCWVMGSSRFRAFRCRIPGPFPLGDLPGQAGWGVPHGHGGRCSVTRSSGSVVWRSTCKCKSSCSIHQCSLPAIVLIPHVPHKFVGNTEAFVQPYRLHRASAQAAFVKLVVQSSFGSICCNVQHFFLVQQLLLVMSLLIIFSRSGARSWACNMIAIATWSLHNSRHANTRKRAWAPRKHSKGTKPIIDDHSLTSCLSILFHLLNHFKVIQ